MLPPGSADRATRARRAAAGGGVVAIALCAQWCTTCLEFAVTFENVAAARPDACLLWIDIEDDAVLLGDVDIETFPTIAVFTGTTLRHFGPVPPHAALIERLLDDAAALSAPAAPATIAALMHALLRG